ncbi:hypothetical protein [Pelagovum sp. HNIBRBA483]|uniref:hypothetical protein n=1 Tax=Pelagovum sp. HNIBRBA483 TaxID=3233341 RepID=UPI0034A1F3FB
MSDFIEGQPARADASTDEIIEAYRVPAPGANKFIINLGRPGLRIAFGEMHDQLEKPVFHSGVTLHPLDAIRLYKILQEMLEPIERNFREQGVISSEPSEDGGH